MLRAVGWGGCARGCSGRWGVLRGTSRGAAVRAGNALEDDGAASLAPTLGRMAQLTSLNLSCTLRASAGSCAVSGCLQTPAMHGLRCVLWAEAGARGAVVGGGCFRGASQRGGGACRQCDRSSWGSVAGTEYRTDDAADVAGPRWYAAASAGQLRCERVLANAGCALVMLRAVGWGGCARGRRGWWEFCERRAEGRRGVQAMKSTQPGHARLHRLSAG